MRSLFSSLVGYFLTPAGVVVLGALDSSLIFFLPLGIDLVLVVLSARTPDLFWAYTLGAAAGSMIGAGATYWIGHTIGTEGLGRWIGKARIDRVHHQVTDKAAAAVAALGLIPPPFPFTALVLASGAFGLNAGPFLGTLALVRTARFGVESALAAKYGQQILTWMESTAFEVGVGILIVISLIGTALSAIRVVRQSR